MQVFYSDDLTHEVVLYEQDAEGRPVEVDRTTPEPLSALTAAQNKTLIGPDDPWFLATRTVRCPHPWHSVNIRSAHVSLVMMRTC